MLGPGFWPTEVFENEHPQRLTDFGRALISSGVDPGTVEVSLPALQRLAKALQADTGSAIDELIPPTLRDYIEIMGVRYLVWFDA